MLLRELAQSSHCKLCFWTHMIQSGMMIWLTSMLIIHFSNNTWCTSLWCHSCSCIITICSSITRTSNSSLRLCLDILSYTPKLFTLSTESKSLDATSSMNTFKWELMNLFKRDNIFSRVKIWKNGFGILPILKKLLLDAIDNHGKMMPAISLILSSCSKISSEDTLMIPSRSHFKSGNTKLVYEDHISRR